MVVFVLGCAEQKPELEVMRANVMKIHDDSMEKMGEIRKAAFDLEDMATSHPDSTIIKQLIQDLEAADEGMMVWMSEYKEPDDESQLESFYAQEKGRIQKVADKIYKTLEDANEYFKN